jgi:hypothetical protein
VTGHHAGHSFHQPRAIGADDGHHQGDLHDE